MDLISAEHTEDNEDKHIYVARYALFIIKTLP